MVVGLLAVGFVLGLRLGFGVATVAGCLGMGVPRLEMMTFLDRSTRRSK